tara:strand:- start:43 stop:495 length:453 start_codon:yes stop_codon:yes gene_type:complete
MELNNRNEAQKYAESLDSDGEKALKKFLLDHYKHFNFWPEEFEHNGIVYNYKWIWGQLALIFQAEKFNFFEEMNLVNCSRCGQKAKFSLFNYMAEILDNFYTKNNLEHCCALESLIGRNYENEEQKAWLIRFGEIWDRVEQRSLRENNQC